MRTLLMLCVIAALTACGKKQAPPAASEAPASAPPAATPGASVNTQASDDAQENINARLAKLTQVVRKYAAENRTAPKSLDELVRAGYLPEAPVAPAGKRFVIDDQLRVTLK